MAYYQGVGTDKPRILFNLADWFKLVEMGLFSHWVSMSQV